MFVCFQPSKLLWLPIYVFSIWQSCCYHIWMNTLSLPGNLVEFASSAELLSHSTSSSSVSDSHKEGQILQTRLSKDVISLLYIFIYWHLFKYAHIRNKINNSCWSSRYIMQYAFNMLTNAWMYTKVYYGCICVYNWRGYLSQHCKPSRTKGKNIYIFCNVAVTLQQHWSARKLVYRRQVLRWFHIYLVLSKHAQMHIWFTLFENQKEPPLLSDRGKWRSGGKIDILVRMAENFFLRCVYENCWCCCHCPYNMVGTIKAATFQQYVERHFLTFVQSMISEFTIIRLDLICDSYPDQSLTRLTQKNQGSGVNTHHGD